MKKEIKDHKFINKKVSVIVPIYNVAPFVAKCIESIMQQSYKNIEIVLVDDGSTDDSGKICDEYEKKDERITVIHKKNAGVSAARNRGIDASTGDYVCFVDGDDYIMQDYVEYLLKLAEDNNTDIALSTKCFTSYDLKQNLDTKEVVYSGERATEAILCYEIPIGVYNKIFTKKFLDNGVRFEENLCIGEGFNFNTAAFQRAEFVAIGRRKIYFYRKDNENSVTTKFNAKKWQNGLYALQMIKKNFVINSVKLDKAWEFAWWRTNTDVYDLLILADAKKEHQEMYSDCRQVMKKYKFSCFGVPTSFMQRARAVVMWICPVMIPLAMKIRKKKYHVNVSNR
ncbi:MAG TPA: glycosyl transferase family 2 [Eubacterium sp.]|nr:glycosyl transferase family 2 [Eubacterium sp.]